MTHPTPIPQRGRRTNGSILQWIDDCVHPGRAAFALGMLASIPTVAADLMGRPALGMPLAGVVFAIAAIIAAGASRTIPLRGALLFGVGVLPAYLAMHRWMIGITAPGYVVLSVTVALHASAFVWLAAMLRRRTDNAWVFALGAGLLLGAVDVFRGKLYFGGYPWYLTASDSLNLPFVALLASLVGKLGVNTAVCVLVGVWIGLGLAVERGVLRRAGRDSDDRGVWLHFAFVLFVMTILTAGLARTPDSAAMDPDGVLIAIVQTNVPQSNKQLASMEDRVEQFNDAARMTAMAGERSPSLIVWPETMFPGSALNDGAVGALRESGASYFEMTADLRDALLAVQSRVGAPMLVGAMALESPRVVPDEDPGYVRLEHDGSYNSVFLIEGGEVNAGRYDKIYLTPFGEVMPLISRWKWLERQLLAFGAPGMSFDLSAGAAEHIFEIAGTRLATPICFEITIPHMCRRLVFRDGERRAGVMINVTNDGWFGSSRSGRLKHLLLSRWRAAELATPVVRAANTGVSVLIDERGRVVTDDEFVTVGGSPAPNETGLAARDRVAGVLFTRVVPGTRTTLYARTGDVVGWATLLAGLALAAWAVWPRKNHRPGTPPAANLAPAGNASGA